MVNFNHPRRLLTVSEIGALGYGSPSEGGLVMAELDTERRKLADQGKALPDGSFPIRNRDDLADAIQSYGRAKDKGEAKRWIKKRARELNAEKELPEDW
jgi:hypothetical protein